MSDGSITYTKQKSAVVTDNLNDVYPSQGQDIVFFHSNFQPNGYPSLLSNFWQGFTFRAQADDYFMQFVMGLSGDVYVRTAYQGNWSNWTQL